MGKMTSIKANNRQIRVAEIKKDYILNIVQHAEECPHITRIVLFGSALDERCKDDSDIGLAVFGDMTETRIYGRKSYNDFCAAVTTYRMMEQYQTYDILYFDEKAQHKDRFFLEEISAGQVLYERQI